MERNDLKDKDFAPSITFMKTIVEGFFCPICNMPIIRAKNLIFSFGNQEYWKCLECNQKMRLTEDSCTIHFEMVDEIPEEKILTSARY